MKFKDLKDLMDKIDVNRPKGRGILYCNMDVIPYLTKMIPEFQLSEQYPDTLNRGQGFAGMYQDDYVWIHPNVPPKNIIWMEDPTRI